MRQKSTGGRTAAKWILCRGRCRLVEASSRDQPLWGFVPDCAHWTGGIFEHEKQTVRGTPGLLSNVSSIWFCAAAYALTHFRESDDVHPSLQLTCARLTLKLCAQYFLVTILLTQHQKLIKLWYGTVSKIPDTKVCSTLLGATIIAKGTRWVYRKIWIVFLGTGRVHKSTFKSKSRLHCPTQGVAPSAKILVQTATQENASGIDK